jgi:uncharacterized protein (TIGR03032 family)
MTSAPPPFTCTSSPGFAELLHQLKCSIAISTYQAGKLIFISPKNDHELIQFPRTFAKPMGIAVSGNKIAVATQNEVVVYSDSPGQAKNYPKRPAVFDAMFIPRATYYTGELDIHDIHFVNDELLAVNTRFSCISRINDDYSFTGVWQPSFIDQLEPQDRCHLNGMVISNGILKYVTALGETNTAKGWRPGKANGGVLVDAQTQNTLLRGLPMPHSPRLYREGLFILLSATGELVRADVERGSYEVIYSFDGFVRGMDRIGDFLFIGLSKLRTTSTAFGDLPIASKSPICGVAVFHLPSGKMAGYLKYETSVEEIYEIRIMRATRPAILSIEKNEHEGVITVPEGVYWPTPVEPKS